MGDETEVLTKSCLKLRASYVVVAGPTLTRFELHCAVPTRISSPTFKRLASAQGQACVLAWGWGSAVEHQCRVGCDRS